MKEDSKIVLEGETHANPDADVQGDLILIVKVKPHDVFKRHNNDLIIEKEINLVEDLCGVSFLVKQLDGRELLIKSNNVIQPNSRHVVNTEGMPKKDGSYGDLLIDFNSLLSAVRYLYSDSKSRLVIISLSIFKIIVEVFDDIAFFVNRKKIIIKNKKKVFLQINLKII